MSEKSEKENTGKNKKRNLIIIGVIILIAVLGILVFWFTRSQKDEPKRNVVVTKDNVNEIVDDMLDQEYVEPGYYSTSMSTVWHFATGGAVSEDAYVENVEENTNDVYFDVFLADNEEEAILKSPVLPRGCF